jgi:hypothetical protein
MDFSNHGLRSNTVGYTSLRKRKRRIKRTRTTTRKRTRSPLIPIKNPKMSLTKRKKT